MDKTTHQAWWALHRRAARNESLNPEESAVYESGLSQLHQEELFNGDMAMLRQMRAKVAALADETAKLYARRDRLEAEIAALEAALSKQTSPLLSVEA